MKELCDIVDPFFGLGETDFPPKEGLAATWFFPKAQTGNNHPGACLPFGMVSACAYSGAYSTGYGVNAPNYHGRPAKLFDKLEATGFTHFHHSGTGAVGTYYNYFRVVPQLNTVNGLNRRYTLADEVASPGYYSATLKECGIRAELTVTPRRAIHRYSFPACQSPSLAIDFSAGGLAIPGFQTKPSAASLHVSGSGFEGHVVMEGLSIFVCGMVRSHSFAGHLFADGVNLAENQISYQAGSPLPASFGVCFTGKPIDENGMKFELLMAFSLTSVDRAKKHLESFRSEPFETVRLAASNSWNEHLGKIVVEGPEHEKSLFYSCLYHSLIKPCDLAGESPFYNRPEPFFTDLITLWDQYKTALPLIFTFYPETGRKIVGSLLAMAEHIGEFLNGTIMSRDDIMRFEMQSRGLTHHILADAITRRLEGIDRARVLRLMVSDLEKEKNSDFHKGGIAHPFTHTLDLADASFCTALVAASENNLAVRDRALEWAGRWRNVYDKSTGILGKSTYYEGVAWNYSFRLLHDMESRVALHGGDAAFVRDLERFFGYFSEPVRQPVDPADSKYMNWGFSLNRFEGFNNEPDMETPYAFIYAGRHDRTCEVIRAALKHQFHAGRGGLPGNNDSGGLTSAYVWNAIGLFPVAGKPYMLIGSPIFESISLRLPGSEFKIVAKGTSADNIYVRGATLNGQPLDRAWLTMKEFLRGGELILAMSSRPEGWAVQNRPPSYSTAMQLGKGDF